MVSFRKFDLGEGKLDYAPFDPVVVTYFEPAFAEFSVPSDFVQQILDWLHGRLTSERAPPEFPELLRKEMGPVLYKLFMRGTFSEANLL